MISSADNKNEVFKAIDLVNHFKQLRSTNNEKWWSNHVIFEWNNVRIGKNSTKWISVRYTPDIATVKPKKMNVVIRDEVHSGQIMPITQEDVVELRSKFPESKIEARTMKPSLQFQKWSKQVQTQEDRISLIRGEDGNPILPGDEYLSTYYQLAAFIDEIFKGEMRSRTERGTHLMVYLSQHKTATAKEVREAIGHVNDSDTILRDDDANTIRENYPDKYVELMKGVLTVSSNKVGTIIQERISDKSPKNKGAKLPNPMTRISIPIDVKNINNQPAVTIMDKSKPFKCGNSRGYSLATFNGVPINSNNIHKFIPSRSLIDGVINIDSVCFSQLGISLPIKASSIVVQQPIKRENNVTTMCSDIYGDDFFDGFENTSEQVISGAESVIAESETSELATSSNKINQETLLDELSA